MSKLGNAQKMVGHIRMTKRLHRETSLAVRWLTLGFQCRELRLDPWSGNQNAACLKAKEKEKELYQRGLVRAKSGTVKHKINNESQVL